MCGNDRCNEHRSTRDQHQNLGEIESLGQEVGIIPTGSGDGFLQARAGLRECCRERAFVASRRRVRRQAHFVLEFADLLPQAAQRLLLLARQATQVHFGQRERLRQQARLALLEFDECFAATAELGQRVRGAGIDRRRFRRLCPSPGFRVHLGKQTLFGVDRLPVRGEHLGPLSFAKMQVSEIALRLLEIAWKAIERAHIERLLVVGDRLLEVVGALAADAVAVRDRQVVLGRRPVFRKRLPGVDLERLLEVGDGLIEVVGAGAGGILDKALGEFSLQGSPKLGVPLLADQRKCPATQFDPSGHLAQAARGLIKFCENRLQVGGNRR